MIKIQQSKTADTRSCDFSQVTKEQLLSSSYQHRNDIRKGMQYFANTLIDAALSHDDDKINDIDQFHADFITGFKQTGWWDKHRTITRHHLLADDGVPEDVNLIDVLEMIVDCVMAGMGRTGTVYPLDIKPEVLMKAFHNTAEMLKKQIIVE
jgi:protein tyrosine phosphatase